MYTIEIEIQPEMICNEYAHVDHAMLFKLLERGRLGFLDSIGFPNKYFLDSELFLVIADLSAEYLREVKEGIVKVTVDEFWNEGKDLFMTQRILSDKGKECVRGRFRFRFLDGKLKRSIEPPEKFSKAISQFQPTEARNR